MNSFTIQGLRSTYGLDDDVDIVVTDRNNNTLKGIQVNFKGLTNSGFYRTYDTDENGNVKFNLKQRGFEKGDYNVYFGEDPMEPSTYHAINKRITIAAGKTTNSASSTASAASQKAEASKPSLEIKISPEPGKIKVGDKITIYVTSDGKAVNDASVRVSTMFSGIKELKTSSDGKVSYTIERADLYPIHVEKEGYKPADISLEVGMSEETFTPPPEKTNTTNEVKEDTDPGKEIKGNVSEKTNETGSFNEISADTQIAAQPEIESFDNGSYLEKGNYKNILIIGGIIVVLLAITVLLLVIRKLIR
jgi:hypothetical protein